MLDPLPMIFALRRNLIPLIVATALFMENLDATVLATSLPAIAKDLAANPIHLKLALTTYLLALAVFIPASGWMASTSSSSSLWTASAWLPRLKRPRKRAFQSLRSTSIRRVTIPKSARSCAV